MSPICEQHDLMWKTMQNEITEMKGDIKEIKGDMKVVTGVVLRVDALERAVFLSPEAALTKAREEASLVETVANLKKLVYGTAGLMLVAVVLGLVKLVVK